MAVKQKLCSRRGATIMAALLFFLVAAVCGSIILAAATATVSRVKNQAKDAQAYYAVASAAQLIRDDLMDSRWLITLEETYTESEGVKSVNTDVNSIELVDENLEILSNDKENETFVSDLISPPATVNTSMVRDSEITIKLASTEITGYPTIYAKADVLPFKTATWNTEEMGCTLKIKITNCADSDNSKFSNYREADDNGNQLYWVTVSLRSIKIPGGSHIVYDGRNKNGVGTVKRSICLGWADPVIEKVRVS